MKNVKNALNRDMHEATRLTRAGRLKDATALLLRRLGGAAPPAAGAADPASPDAPRGRVARIIELVPDLVRVISARLARPLPAHAPEIEAEGAPFLAASYRNHAGSRAYKLYVPNAYREQPLPLIVMLHGCTQSPDDFAAGTRMNALAEEHPCLVAYPAQSAAANVSRCWNWFNPHDQQRDRGEPSLIAGITRQIMREYAVDPRRVYVAGLSAGAAAAAIMGAAYPDLYAAIGVHSGLACGAATDVSSAFAAMRQGNSGAARRPQADHRPEAHQRPGADQRIVPTIVFHGDRDGTVNPVNGDQIIAQSQVGTELRSSVQHGTVPGGRDYSRTLYCDAGGRALLEQWVVRGAGHAWSGGSEAGSFTDPLGPDASREMLRFFLEHTLPPAAS